MNSNLYDHNHQIDLAECGLNLNVKDIHLITYEEWIHQISKWVRKKMIEDYIYIMERRKKNE